MPAKKGPAKGAQKDYKKSKNEIDDIMNQFGFEEKPKEEVADEVPKIKSDNVDEYGLDDFEVKSSNDQLPQQRDDMYADKMTDFYENSPDKPEFNNDDEYGLSELDFFSNSNNEPKQEETFSEIKKTTPVEDESLDFLSELDNYNNVDEVSEEIDANNNNLKTDNTDSVKEDTQLSDNSIEQFEFSKDSDNSEETYDNLSNSFFSNEASPDTKIEEAANEETKELEDTVIEGLEQFTANENKEPEDVALVKESEDVAFESIIESVNETEPNSAVADTPEVIVSLEDAENNKDDFFKNTEKDNEIEEDKKLELTIDIEPEEHNSEYSDIDEDAYNIENEYRPLKTARQDNMKNSKRDKKKNEEVSLLAKNSGAKDNSDSKEKPKPEHKSNLVFSPETKKINNKLRKKYKIDKDSIFAENDYVDGFILANNEILLRRYDTLKVNGGNPGRILITNKRMLFNTSEKAEIPLSSVNGLRSAKYWTFNWVKFVFGLIFIGIAAFAFIYDFTKFSFFTNRAWLIYIIMAVGAIIGIIGLTFICTFAKRRFALKVFISSAYEFITYNSKKGKKENAVMESVIVAMPGSEIDKFVREAGALIIQSREGFFD